ncbi:MAG: hypothetical protein E7314_04715 [Clostridiales bacterium]|nr:hypothetical protein [Clostridiales bacterium]
MNNILALENYVTIIQNNSNHFSPSEIVRICKRKNNAKRDFLFVNPLQGKHIHVDPANTFTLYDELVLAITRTLNPCEKVVVIGFAETATAIGHYVASTLPNCVYYMQTTRENITNATSLLEFKEEHSHAMEQFLYGDISKLSGCDRIIFVDDEISTGNTVLNFIREIEKVCSNMKYGVATFLNWQDDVWADKFKKHGIDTYFVLRGKLKDLSAKVCVPASCKEHLPTPFTALPEIFEASCSVSNYSKERIGSKPENFLRFCETIYSTAALVLKDKLPVKGENILVLGTEEYMFAPLVLAKMFGEKHYANVQYHATTRSPIATSDYGDYAVKQRYPIRSCYDSTRNTFIYNLEKYDKVYIVTDVIPNSDFVNDISSALVSAGCKPENILIIVMKG